MALGPAAKVALWFSLLLLSAYIVPYGFLSDVPSMAGSFLYWSLFALAIILFILRLMSSWRD